MDAKLVHKIIDECKDMRDAFSDGQLTTWDFFVNVNEIVSEYADEGVECLMNVNFANGSVIQGLCVITDWQPGALAFQSDEGEAPHLQVIFPQDYEAFMESIKPFLFTEYPKFPYKKK
mgnify:CR=1 FL=1